MIIFFNKDTKEIIGHIEGRIHPPEVLKAKISSSSIPDDKVGKYVIPFKKIYKIIKVKVAAGIKPDVPFADLVFDFESGKEKIHDFKVKLNKGKVTGFIKKKNGNT